MQRKLLAFFTIIISTGCIFRGNVTAFQCPEQQQIGLCQCFESSRNIQCVGNSLTSIDLKIDDNYEYGILYINNTSITQINENFSGKSFWQKIIIANNSLLTSIEQNAFGFGPKITLWVQNCPKLSNDSLFNALKSIINTETIIIDSVNINSLSANIFNTSSEVKNIILNNDNISEITSNAFLGLKNLILINLDNNQLQIISSGVLNFTPDSMTRVITVSMRNNKLTDSSFTTETLKAFDNLSFELHLEENDLSVLHESIFRQFLDIGKNKLFVHNNDFHCDCNMVWLLNESNIKNVFNVACIEQKRNIVDINREELCPTITTTTTTTTSSTPSPPTQSPTPITTLSTETITPITTFTSLVTEVNTTQNTVLSTLTTIKTTKSQTTTKPVTTTHEIQTTTKIVFYIKCPQNIDPCDCDESTQWFNCDGTLINDSIISKIGPKIKTNSSQRYDLISITNTKITKLTSITFKNANFTDIFIEDNNDLIDIESNAFIVSEINSLKVRRNRNLIDSEIYELAKIFSPIEVDFSHNSIEELPELAFVFEEKQYNWRLIRIILDNNKITVISSNAFKGLFNLTHLSIKNNLLTVIEDFGLKFDTSDKLVTLLLTNNSIVSQYITNRSISLSSDITLHLDLQRNNLTTIKRNIFEHYFIKNGSELNVNGNQFICTCDMAWILDELVRNRIYNVYCDNHNTFIFDLNVTIFCNA